MRAVVECLAAHESDVVGVVAEEAEAGRENGLHLLPTRRAVLEIAVASRSNQSDNSPSNTSPYSASFEPKWCRRLGRRMPTAAAMSFSEVPS